jgi:hypothetical protein
MVRIKTLDLKNHIFILKNRELFLQNIELKKIGSQSRLLLRQISHGVLLTSYSAKVNIDDDRLDALLHFHLNEEGYRID